MKKISIMLFLIFMMSFCFAQSNDASKIETEYYGLKWGCSVQDLKSKYPDSYTNGKNDQGDEVYYLDGKETTRVFFFGEGKLFSGRVCYLDCTQERLVAIMTKITDTYGKFDDSNKGSDKGNEYLTFTKHYSNKIDIDCTAMDVKNSYGYNVSSMVLVTYTNKELRSKIAKDRINKMQDDLEL